MKKSLLLLVHGYPGSQGIEKNNKYIVELYKKLHVNSGILKRFLRGKRVSELVFLNLGEKSQIYNLVSPTEGEYGSLSICEKMVAKIHKRPHHTKNPFSKTFPFLQKPGLYDEKLRFRREHH
jgi:hypothetical protein